MWAIIDSTITFVDGKKKEEKRKMKKKMVVIAMQHNKIVTMVLPVH